jgi:hypothetical protein
MNFKKLLLLLPFFTIAFAFGINKVRKDFELTWPAKITEYLHKKFEPKADIVKNPNPFQNEFQKKKSKLLELDGQLESLKEMAKRIEDEHTEIKKDLKVQDKFSKAFADNTQDIFEKLSDDKIFSAAEEVLQFNGAWKKELAKIFFEDENALVRINGNRLFDLNDAGMAPELEDDIFDFIERLKSISKAEKITMHEVIVKDQSKLELGCAVNLHRYLLRNFANTTKVVEFKTTVLNPPPEEAPNKAALLIDIPLE